MRWHLTYLSPQNTQQTCNQSDLHAALRVALTEPLETEQADLNTGGGRSGTGVELWPAFMTPERLERLRRAIQRRSGEAAARCVECVEACI